MKIKTITLSYPHPDPNDRANRTHRFRVERITDSVEFLPGQYLAKNEADDLCASNQWKVTSIPRAEES